MKIDKTNPRHWLYLISSGIFTLIAIVWRMLYRNRRTPSVILYGHKFNGNLKAFADYVATIDAEFTLYFLTLDPEYYRVVKAEYPQLKVLLMTRLSDMLRVGQSDVIITDHGLHTLVYLLKYTNIKFVDVWHGIAYKGFTAEDFSFMHSYDEVWASSPTFVEIYEQKWGFKREQVFSTGYARVDRLVRGDYDRSALLKKYRLGQSFEKIVLIAPTWKQDDAGRSILPFGATSDDFFGSINEMAKRHNTLVIFRIHLNATKDLTVGDMSHVRIMPYSDYPQAEEFLYLADVVVSDWSSLLFDYLPLHRPTIFLDVPPPFRAGLTLDASYRFGEVVGSLDELIGAMEEYIVTPEVYLKKYADVIQKTEDAAYGSTLDGRAAERYYQRLQNLLQETK